MLPPPPNPFRNSTPSVSAYEALKLAALLPTVGLARALAVAALLAFAAAWCLLAMLGTDPGRPLPAWRRRVVWSVPRVLSRVILFVLGFYWISVSGRRRKVRAQEWLPGLRIAWRTYTHALCAYACSLHAKLAA